MPGVYSAHSTCTRDRVRPSARTLFTSRMPLAMTSLCSGVNEGLQYSASTFCDAPFSRQYASAFASRGVVASNVSDPVSAWIPKPSSVASSSVMGTFSFSSISATTVAVAPTLSTISSVASMSDVLSTWWSRTTTSSARSSHDAQSASRSRRCASTTPTHRSASAGKARFSRMGNLFLCSCT